MAVQLPEDTAPRVHQALRAYLREHFEVDAGILQTEQFVDFLLGLVGATVYNQGVRDATASMQLKLADVEGDVGEIIEYESDS